MHANVVVVGGGMVGSAIACGLLAPKAALLRGELAVRPFLDVAAVDVAAHQ